MNLHKLNDLIRSNAPVLVLTFAGLGGGGFATLLGDVRWVIGMLAVRNVAFYADSICAGTDEREYWDWLMEDITRFERYTGRRHPLSGVKREQLCARD